MSDTETPKGKARTGWSDHERANTKFNFKTAPLPPGRTLIACERMLGRLKTALKSELDALSGGARMPGDSSIGKAARKSAVPRKRKGRDENEGEGGPVKKGRRAKDAAVKDEDDEEGERKVKVEMGLEEV
ncbi:uncharacterized protein M421DRAFT_2410 [Didymella exigua CBS 183.55]|uniref:Uncharacterized protein n=1 Tax=Didymella exigua CBS 183.55 TaxID=1150837 RepID=A0A6A5RXM7_9PLEO|nr:uncharacterized protein M421DRAFT_2410 [Didymella exigua CBS 183.55]KAF1931778.1 hypothetical protein M421DRAFT_2410 [Didymella exigua CBS 183.55]